MRSVWIGKRQGNRTACSIKAKVFDDENPAIAELTIIDLSPTGARARLEKNVPLPEFFQVSIPARDETRYARLRWHRDVLIGFEFIRISEVEMLKDLTTLTRRLNLLEQSLAQRLNLSEGEGFYADEGTDPGPLGDKTLVPISVIHTTAPVSDKGQGAAKSARRLTCFTPKSRSGSPIIWPHALPPLNTATSKSSRPCRKYCRSSTAPRKLRASTLPYLSPKA